MSDWTQMRDGDWTHPDGRRIEGCSDCWFAYEPGEPWIAEWGDSAHKAAIVSGWDDFPADPHDPETMLGFLTLCAVLRVWVEGWTQTTAAEAAP